MAFQPQPPPQFNRNSMPPPQQQGYPGGPPPAGRPGPNAPNQFRPPQPGPFSPPGAPLNGPPGPQGFAPPPGGSPQGGPGGPPGPYQRPPAPGFGPGGPVPGMQGPPGARPPFPQAGTPPVQFRTPGSPQSGFAPRPIQSTPTPPPGVGGAGGLPGMRPPVAGQHVPTQGTARPPPPIGIGMNPGMEPQMQPQMPPMGPPGAGPGAAPQLTPGATVPTFGKSSRRAYPSQMDGTSAQLPPLADPFSGGQQPGYEGTPTSPNFYDNNAGAAQPTYGQPGVGFVPAAQPPMFNGNAAAPANSGYAPAPAPLSQQSSTMSMNAGDPHPGYSKQGGGGPRAYNLMQSEPPIHELDAEPPRPWIANTSSIAGSPMANCPPSYQRCTFNAIPNTTQLLSKCKIPLALVTSPFRHLLPGDEPVPVIQPEQIVRCRRCRTYINPWVQFVEQGTRWKCNLCYVVNEVPSFFDWDPETRQPRDRMKRVELTHSVIDFIAPQEYMVRPPQPVVFFFVIDVSYNAIQSGMVATAAKAILSALDSIPNSDSRTKVGIMTVDSTLHFYNLNAQASEPQMLVVADLEDVYLPLPEDLLVLLSESRGIIESLLGRIGDMFKGTQNVQNALGPALKSAYKLLSPIGGKIIVLQATLPTLHDGALKAREDSKLLGTPKEATLLQPASGFYKALAVDCSRAQVSVDLFAFSPQYTDIATLSGLAKYTGGSTYYYPGFNAARPEDALKFANELTHFLGRPLLLEAVLRVRASRGIRLTAFHGNFFLRSTDLLALPNVNPDNAYAIEMTLEENLSTSLACFQSAVLCTASSGERRIRVVTLAVPTTGNLQDCFLSTDQSALAVLLAKKAVERSLSSKIEDARDAIVHKLTDIMGAYKQNFTTSGQAVQLLLPENLKLLPLLILGLLKHSAFRATGTIPSDMRAHVLGLQYVFPLEFAITNIHPRFWALHNIDIQGDNNGEVVFPPTLNLTSAKLERHGLYLLETGMEIFLWVGRAVPQEVCSLLFDKPSYDQIPTGKVILPALQNAYSQKVNGLINKIRHIRLLMFTSYPHLYIVKEDGDQSLRMWFLSHLIEDRIEQAYSYPQWLGHLRDQMAKVSSG